MRTSTRILVGSIALGVVAGPLIFAVQTVDLKDRRHGAVADRLADLQGKLSDADARRELVKLDSLNSTIERAARAAEQEERAVQARVDSQKATFDAMLGPELTADLKTIGDCSPAIAKPETVEVRCSLTPEIDNLKKAGGKFVELREAKEALSKEEEALARVKSEKERTRSLATTVDMVVNNAKQTEERIAIAERGVTILLASPKSDGESTYDRILIAIVGALATMGAAWIQGWWASRGDEA